MANDTILDLDAMMDMEMDKVETLPDFVMPPAGNYELGINDCKIEPFTQKPKEGQPERKGNRIRLTYEVKSTLDLANASDYPVKDGSLFSETFMGTEEGLKYFKKQAMNILNVTDLTGARMKDVMDGLKDTAPFKARITIRTSDDGKGGKFENVQIRPVHEASAA